MLFSMRSLRSLSSQKTGAIYSLVLLVAVMVLVIGILSVSSSKFSTTPAQQFTPRWVLASAANASLNITITNDASSPAAIKRVDITKPSGVINLECGANSPAGWTCAGSPCRFPRPTEPHSDRLVRPLRGQTRIPTADLSWSREKISRPANLR